MKMKIYIQPVIIIALIMVYGFVSCSKEIEYDEAKNKEYWKRVSPVDSIDVTHTWQLATSRSYLFTVNANVGAQRLEIYNADPITSADAEMMGRAFVKDGQQVTMSVSVPSILTTLYAALIDKDGTYTVTSFNATERLIDFSNPTATQQQPRSTTPKIMAYTYCYEENFPAAGDYDYNDLVIRIGLERTGQKKMDLHLTLLAVGASGQIAGAIRLVGYRYQDIDSIVAKDGKTLNVNVPKLSYGLIESDDILQKGRNGEAVLNLFVDAHWAMDTEIETINDDFTRKKYNVKRSFTDQYEQTYAKDADYTIYFKNDNGLNNFTQEMIDPFIVTYYMANRIETHLDEFKDAQVFYNYDNLEFKTLPWALKIPTSYFHYPLEGFRIGFRKHAKDGTASMDGAYMIEGHSFGEWVENHKNSLDWYNYPIEIQVW
jgi:LruC domain-containing protein